MDVFHLVIITSGYNLLFGRRCVNLRMEKKLGEMPVRVYIRGVLSIGGNGGGCLGVGAIG